MKEIGMATCFLIFLLIATTAILVIPFVVWVGKQFMRLFRFLTDQFF